MTSEDIDKTSNFIDSHHDDVIIKAVGVGGGGDNAVNHMYEQGIDKVSFVVCNTDKQALDNSPVPNRLLIGPTTTKGRGAGNKPELAREAAEESAEDIDALFDDGTQMVFITAGMGGGTGTGAAPVVARIARERGLLTVGIVTIPFLFEGQKKILKALDGAEELSKYVDSLLVVNNEQLTEIYPDLDWVNACKGRRHPLQRRTLHLGANHMLGSHQPRLHGCGSHSARRRRRNHLHRLRRRGEPREQGH